MVRSCAAFGCTNRWKAGSDVTFHKIPKESQLRQKWLQNIMQEGKLPQDESFFICSSHFEESCFQRDLKVNLFPITLTFIKHMNLGKGSFLILTYLL